MEGKDLFLTTADYLVIAVCLLISASIGVIFKCFGKKQITNDEYILAGRNMAIIPVSFSMMATFMSTTTLMGVPAEMYLYGTHMAFMNVGFIIGIIFSAFFFLPLYFSSGVATAYEYLEKRFGKLARRISSFIFILQMILFTAVTLYAPALALNAVAGISTWVSVASTGIICTFYCTLGGMKAVLWTDVFQAILMFWCIITIIVMTCLDLGGIENIFRIANDGGRLVIPSFNTDVTARYTMWNILLQSIIITVATYGCSQLQVQRMLTVKNIQRSRIAALVSIPMITGFHLLTCMCGIAFYVYFRECDPMTSEGKSIHSPDQLMPYYIVSSLGRFPGLPGICIAGIFSASLSTISSQINSLAAVTSEDVIRPMWKISDTKLTYFTKALTIIYGCLCVALTFLVAAMGNLVQISLALLGIFSGPTVGFFLLAALTTTANENGAVLGALSGVGIAAWLTFASTKRKYDTLPVSNGCPVMSSFGGNHSGTTFDGVPALNFTSFENISNFTSFANTTLPISHHGSDSDQLPLSYMWVSSIALVTCLTVGYLASIIIGQFTAQKEVDEVYLSPIALWVYSKISKVAKKAAESKDIEQVPSELSKIPAEIKNRKNVYYINDSFQYTQNSSE